MSEIAKNYILKNYTKIADLKITNKSSIELVVENYSKNIFVRKTFYRKLIFYKKLVTLQHKNMAKIHILFLDDNATYLIEEYIKGETLANILLQKPFLPEKQVITIALQLCSCLEYLHRNKIVHLDINPSNIMLCEDNLVKIIDFDASKEIGKIEDPKSRKLGTKGYAPPEQYGFSQISEKSDIYSLGITLKELLGNNYQGYLKDIYQKCTNLDPKQRISDIKTLELLIRRPNRSIKKILFFVFLLITTYSFVILAENYNFFTYFYKSNTKKFLSIEPLLLNIPLNTYEKNIYCKDNLQIISQKVPSKDSVYDFNIYIQVTANIPNNQMTQVKIVAENIQFIKSNSPEKFTFIKTAQNKFQTVLNHNFYQKNKILLSFDYISNLTNPLLQITISDYFATITVNGLFDKIETL